MGVIKGDRSVEIDAPMARCYEIASDIDHAAEWQGSLKDVEVLERDGEKRAPLVETESDAKVKTVGGACCASATSRPPAISWVQEKGDTKSLHRRLGLRGPRRRPHARDLLARGRPRPHARACCCADRPSPVRDFLLGDAAAGLKARAEGG